jgi:hypothetical protein
MTTSDDKELAARFLNGPQNTQVCNSLPSALSFLKKLCADNVGHWFFVLFENTFVSVVVVNADDFFSRALYDTQARVTVERMVPDDDDPDTRVNKEIVLYINRVDFGEFEDEDEDEDDVEPNDLAPGSNIQALYSSGNNKAKDGQWFSAKIISKNKDGTYQIEWDDGDKNDLTKEASKISVNATQLSEENLALLEAGDKVDWLAENGKLCPAKIAKPRQIPVYYVDGWANGEARLEFDEGVTAIKKPHEIRLNVAWLTATLDKRRKGQS